MVIGEAAGRFTWYRLAPGALAPVEDQVRSLAASGQTLRLRAAYAG